MHSSHCPTAHETISMYSPALPSAEASFKASVSAAGTWIKQYQPVGSNDVEPHTSSL